MTIEFFMKIERIWKNCLTIASINCFVMAGAHFVLPVFFEWNDKLAEVHEIFPWALGVFNFSWGFIFLFFSIIVLHIAFKGPKDTSLENIVIPGLGGYWIIHAIYLLINQAPLPINLDWLGILLLVFPVLMGLLHLIPFWLVKKL